MKSAVKWKRSGVEPFTTVKCHELTVSRRERASRMYATKKKNVPRWNLNILIAVNFSFFFFGYFLADFFLASA